MKIYGTLGPSCADRRTLETMFENGMSGVRLNLSHGSLDAAAERIAALHGAAEHCGVKTELIIDMQGPELRIGQLEAPLPLEKGARLLLGRGGLPVPEAVLPHLVKGQELLLDDGKILAVVEEAGEDCAGARVLRGGFLSSRKSLALPGTVFHPPTLTETDRENIKKALHYGVTGLMQPFVRDRQDLLNVRAALDGAGGQDIKIYAKIENLEGVEHLDELMGGCDEIVIARGDLGNAVKLWELPALQKRIAACCRAAGRPFMVVTQMLASMERSPVPTRAEMSDIFNAVLDGASSVMVTGETAVGAYPAEAIKYLYAAARAGLDYLEEKRERKL